MSRGVNNLQPGQVAFNTSVFPFAFDVVENERRQNNGSRSENLALATKGHRRRAAKGGGESDGFLILSWSGLVWSGLFHIY